MNLINYALQNFEKIIISVGCLKKKELNKLIKLIQSNKKIKRKQHCYIVLVAIH